MRNVMVLAVAQFFGAFGQVASVLLAGLIGTSLAPDPALATVPVATAVIGIAAATIPVGMALQRWGRRPVLLVGSLITLVGCLLAAWALQRQDFAMYSAATFIVGANLAFTAQYRFAAVEAVAPEQASQAVTRVMLGTLGAAFVSPWLAVASRNWIGAEFTGSYLTLAGILALNFLAVTAYAEPPRPAAAAAQGGRPLRDIVRQPVFRLAATAAAVAYGVMALLMTATPISMHLHDGHSVEDTALVLQSHVVGMYAPSFITGLLVARLGVTAMLAAGLGANALCAVLALNGQRVAQYWTALTLLGVGWNLLFVAATTLLTRAYRPDERFRVQTANDFLMFAVMAAASLGAGPLMAVIGWRGLNELALALMAVLAVAMVLGRRKYALPPQAGAIL
jgi:predicted MFS family arabinose efflux permease